MADDSDYRTFCVTLVIVEKPYVPGFYWAREYGNSSASHNDLVHMQLATSNSAGVGSVIVTSIRKRSRGWNTELLGDKLMILMVSYTGSAARRSVAAKPAPMPATPASLRDVNSFKHDSRHGE